MLGLGSQVISLTANMLVTYIVADRQALLSIIADPDRFYAATPYTFLVASLIVLTLGAGKLSVDAWIALRQPVLTPLTAQSVPAAVVTTRCAACQRQSP